MEAETCNRSVTMDSGNPLLRAVFLRRLRLTRLLLEGGAYINESDSQGQTPLMVACRTKYMDSQSASQGKLIQFLLKKGADPNIQDKEGRTALMHACREQAGTEVVSLLLASGADPSLEDQSGTSALVYAVMAGDLKILEVLLDTCKAKGKEVIIIATETIPRGNLSAKQYLSTGLVDSTETIPQTTSASPSEIQLITSAQGTSSSLCPPKPVVAFKEGQICGVSSHPCSPCRFRGLGPVEFNGLNGLQQPLMRLNSEPWLKIPASLLSQQPQGAVNKVEDLSFGIPKLDEDSCNDSKTFKCYEGRSGKDRSIGSGKTEFTKLSEQNISLSGLLSSHSASHPNLHSEILGADSVPSSSTLSSGKSLCMPFHSSTSTSLHSVNQICKLGPDVYGSDPQLAVQPPEEQKAKIATDSKKLAPLRCSSTLGSRDLPAGQNRRVPSLYERRGSGTFLLDHNLGARPRSLPPLTNNLVLNVSSPGNGSSFSEKELGQRIFLPSAPPGHPKDLSRRLLQRRHSIQTEQFKTTT